MSYAVEVLQAQLDEVDKELDKRGVRDLLNQRESLMASIESLTNPVRQSSAGSNGSSTPVLRLDEILVAFDGDPDVRLSSGEIASKLGVDTHHVGPRTIKLAEEGSLRREGDFYMLPLTGE